MSPTFTARDLELYFDSTYLPADMSIEKRVVMWKKWGVHVIYADCWEYYTDPKRHNRFSFDYARLIKNCHANGIAVYAWFELPYVSQDFAAANPQWQEKSASGGNLDRHLAFTVRDGDGSARMPAGRAEIRQPIYCAVMTGTA